MAREFSTVQNRHADKYLNRLGTVTRYSLDNHFHGETVAPENAAKALRDKLAHDIHIKVNSDKTKGRLDVHSNLWYEFDINPEAK